MRLYLIGAGAIARQHARAAEALAGRFHEMHVCGRGPAGLREFSAAHPGFKPWDSAAAMLSAPAEPGDLVVVATPPESHQELGLLALRSGRDLLMEKPITRDLAGLRLLLDEAKARGLRLADCATRFSATPCLRKAGDLLAGALGPARRVSWVHRSRRNRPGIEYQGGSHWFLDRAKAWGGVVMDWAPYDMAALCELLAPKALTVHRAWGDRFTCAADPQVTNDVETYCLAQATMECDHGPVELHYERSSALFGEERQTPEVEARAGALRLDWLGWLDQGRLRVFTDQAGLAQEQVLDPGADLDLHFKPLHFFAQAQAGETGPLPSSGEMAFRHACVLALDKAMREGVPVTVERGDWV